MGGSGGSEARLLGARMGLGQVVVVLELAGGASFVGVRLLCRWFRDWRRGSRVVNSRSTWVSNMNCADGGRTLPSC